MKRFIAVLALTLMLPISAHAAWIARAESAFGWGEGISNNLETAKRIALNECAKRTPSNYVCVIVAWDWVD